jgi:hypothetical protein
MGEKTASVGHFQIPTAPAALTAVAQSASANTLGSAVSFGNSPSALYITGVTIGAATTQVPTYVQIQILVAAGIVGSVLVPYGVSSGVAASVLTGYRAIYPPIPVANGAAITVKSASSVASAVSWGVSLECIAQANVVDDGVAVGTVTTVTNQLTAAAIATGVWQDAVAGDFTVASSIGKSLFISNIAPGASGGHMIAGSNAGTTTFGALTVTGATTLTGNVVLSDGLTISAPSTLNRAGLDVAGNGTGAAFKLVGGATGVGFSIAGGGTSGDGIKVTTTSGHGVNLAPVGTSMHGLFSTGGNGGTSDGIKAAAGTGGVDLRAAITGNVTGNLSGSVGSVTGAVGSVTGAVGSVTGAVGSVTGAVGSVTGAVGSVTGNVGGNVVGSVASVTAAVTVGTISNNVITAASINADAITAAKIADGAIDAATFAAGAIDAAAIAADAIGSSELATSAVNEIRDAILDDATRFSGAKIDAAISSRLATSGYTAPLDAAGTRSAVGLASANLDTQLGTLMTSAAYTAPDNAGITSIKTQTDKLVFTVANKLDVNLLVVNGVTVGGAGTAGNPWGPA